MNDDLIWKLTESQYELSRAVAEGQGLTIRRWEHVPQWRKDAAYDVMWKTLHLLKEPTDEMVTAGSHEVGGENARGLFRVMINNLLEVKNPS